MPTPNTVLLSGYPLVNQEKTCSEAILPGHLVDFVLAGGTAGQLRKHNVAAGPAAPYFARESLTPDRGATTLPIETPYQVGETARWFDGRQCMVLALIPAAAVIVTGDALVSNGDGTLKKQAIAADVIVARAAESITAGAGPTRCRVYPTTA